MAQRAYCVCYQRCIRCFGCLFFERALFFGHWFAQFCCSSSLKSVFIVLSLGSVWMFSIMTGFRVERARMQAIALLRGSPICCCFFDSICFFIVS